MPSKNSILTTIGSWFAREPAVPVAVAAFGKSAVVNGHQDLAGDPTKSLLEFARITYYEGALPNCTAWESQLRDSERVLANHIVRWCDGRLTVARVSAVAEGGATTKAFAPMLSCAEVDGDLGLAALARIDESLAAVEPSLLDARPDKWASLLAPVRAAILEDVTRQAPAARSPGGAGDSVGAALSAASAAFLARLGDVSSAWTESLAEELDLAMSFGAPVASGRSGSRSGAATVRSRQTDAPRTGADVLIDLKGWGTFLRATGPNHPEWWLFGGEGVSSIHIVVGRPHERDFACLWRSPEAANRLPEPLPASGRGRAAERTRSWLEKSNPLK